MHRRLPYTLYSQPNVMSVFSQNHHQCKTLYPVHRITIPFDSYCRLCFDVGLLFFSWWYVWLIASRILHLCRHTSCSLASIILAIVASCVLNYFRFLKVNKNKQKFSLTFQLSASTQLCASLIKDVVLLLFFKFPYWNQYHCCLCFTAIPLQPVHNNFINILTVLLKGPFC